MIDQALLKKYNLPLPRYTSYPPANFFHDGFTGEDYLQAIEQSNQELPQAISLYLHIPFCPQLCFYCGCNMHVSRQSDYIARYIDMLTKEIGMIAARVDTSRPVTQIHWGGGTPNALDIDQVERIMDTLRHHFNLLPNAETVMECNPAYLSEEYIQRLLRAGFNRISLGIQDFDEKVLKTVNREPSAMPVEEIKALLKEKGAALNLDFIYGLPHQTEASFLQSIRRAIKIKPKRLVTFSYAHVPWVKSHQKVLEKSGLPGPDEKMAMFSAAWRELTAAGYLPIGMDHFALPSDPLSVALEEHQLHRNFQGYCTRETTGQVYAFGVSAISQLNSAYAQNNKTIKGYMEAIANDEPATVKGYRPSHTDIAVREVINELMCNNYLDWEQVARRLSMSPEHLRQLTGFNPARLEPLVADGLVLTDNQTLEVTQTGRFLIRNIAALFDPKLKGTQKRFSKTV